MRRFSVILLSIDVGNTTTSFSVCSVSPSHKALRFISQWVYPTKKIGSKTPTSGNIRKKMKSLEKAYPDVNVVVSSVVPRIDPYLRKILWSIFKKRPLFVTSKIESRIKIRYKNPSEVGSDRIANARGALAISKGPLIIVDFGTATTFDCVSRKNEYWGGVITPGPVISAESLYERTAKLPFVPFKRKARILGRNTRESIEAGLFFGYRGLIKEILVELKKKMGPGTKVLATGGDSRWIMKEINKDSQIIPHLTHLGLVHTWLDVHGLKNNRKKFEFRRRR